MQVGQPQGMQVGGPQGMQVGDHRGHEQGETPQGTQPGNGTEPGEPWGPSQQLQPPCAGTRAFPVLSDKGPEPALCQHFQHCFPRRNQTLEQEHAWISALPTPGSLPHGLSLGREKAQ